MADIKPVIRSISPFDASKDYVLEFVYSYSQIFGRHVVIKENDTNLVIVDYTTTNETEDRMLQKHTIAANTLENGKTYNVVVSIIDVRGNESPSSNAVVFSCYSTPIFIFTNVEQDDLIGSPNFTFTLSYSQAENLTLDSYVIEMFDYTRSNRVYTTGLMYDNALTTTINGLADNEHYYIHAYGSTINGIAFETDYIYFNVDYITPDVFTLLTLENVPDEASIKVSSNFVIIEGRNEGNISFDDSYVIIPDGSKVIFDEGFKIDKDCTILATFRAPQENKQLLYLSNGVDSAIITWRVTDFGNGRCNYLDLIIDTKVTQSNYYRYIIFSNMIPEIKENTIIKLRITKINGLFTMEIKEAV